jgi:iron-sulfur cluster repair protein YtfE (RIC family)
MEGTKLMTIETPTCNATPLTATDALNQIVARYPQTLSVLHRFGFDTCCGGSLPLNIAVEHHGLDLAEVLAALHAAITEAGA